MNFHTSMFGGHHFWKGLVQVELTMSTCLRNFVDQVSVRSILLTYYLMNRKGWPLLKMKSRACNDVWNHILFSSWYNFPFISNTRPRASRYIPARNEQKLDSSSFNGSLGRFCGDNIQASDDRAKLPDQKCEHCIVVPPIYVVFAPLLLVHVFVCICHLVEMQAEGVLTQKELRSMASVEDV